MTLHKKYFHAAEIDLEAAKILSKKNFFPPALYHLQQAYEKCIKSYYIFRLTSRGITEKRVNKKCKELGHDTEELTIKLLAVVMQMDIDDMQKARRKLTDPDDLRIMDNGLAAVKSFKASIGRMVTRNNLKIDYIKNIRNYPRIVQKLYDYNQRSSSSEVVLRQPGQNILLFDIAVITLIPILYKMEEITRYPHADFSYDNINVLSTRMKEPCQYIIEMMADLFSLVKTACKQGSDNILNLPF